MVEGSHSALVGVKFFLQRQRCAENSTHCSTAESSATVPCAGECVVKVPDPLPQL